MGSTNKKKQSARLRACLTSPRARLGGIFSALTALKILAIRQDSATGASSACAEYSCMTPRWGHCTIWIAAAFCLAGQKTYLANPHTLRY
jgi:hypothetical protein